MHTNDFHAIIMQVLILNTKAQVLQNLRNLLNTKSLNWRSFSGKKIYEKLQRLEVLENVSIHYNVFIIFLLFFSSLFSLKTFPTIDFKCISFQPVRLTSQVLLCTWHIKGMLMIIIILPKKRVYRIGCEWTFDMKIIKRVFGEFH